MSLTTPILDLIKTFDASKEQTITFVVSSGNQVVRHNIVIYDNLTNVEIYNQTVESFQLKHTLPSNILTNGMEYKCVIRIGDINNAWSNFSSPVVFYCYSAPTINITNIDYANQNRVYNQTVTFSATYSQAESEILQSYKYILYDTNQSIISSFKEIFADGSLVLEQEITGLENGTLYYIEVKTLSVHGYNGSSGLISFKPFYINPRLSVTLTPENLSELGSIKVSANILQLIGKLYDPNGVEINPLNIEYVDNEWLDLTRIDYAKLVFHEGFKINSSDFVLKLWISQLPDDVVFMKLYSDEGYVEFMKYSDRIHAFKYLNGVAYPAHFASNEVIMGLNDFMLYMKSENNLLDLQTTLL